MKTGRGNRSTGRKPTPAPLCPPQIPLDQTWSRFSPSTSVSPANLQNCYGDHLEVAFHPHWKRRTQLIGESLQEFATTIDHLAHRAHVRLWEHLITNRSYLCIHWWVKGARHKTTDILEERATDQPEPPRVKYSHESGEAPNQKSPCWR
jgi:hypothetical protein